MGQPRRRTSSCAIISLVAAVACLGLYFAYAQCHLTAQSDKGRSPGVDAPRAAVVSPEQLLSPSCGRRAVQRFPADFWFVKTHKTGSSTLSGVFRTICSHYGVVPVKRELVQQSQQNTFNGGDGVDSTDMLALRRAILNTYSRTDAPAVAVVNHLKFSQAKVALFRQQPLLLFTTVRHPLPRVYSQFFDDTCWRLRAAKGSVEACQQFGSDPALAARVMAADTVENRWEYLRKYPQNHIYHYIRGGAVTVEDAARQYFIFVAERMDQALVVFMLEFGLSFADIAHLSVKNNSGTYKPAKDMPPEMNAFVMERNQLDLQLWQEANRQLDARIQRLQQACGAGHFAALLATFKRLQAAVRRECADYKGWYASHGFGPPYTYVSDNGVGYRCVEHAARQFLAAEMGG